MSERKRFAPAATGLFISLAVVIFCLWLRLPDAASNAPAFQVGVVSLFLFGMCDLSFLLIALDGWFGLFADHKKTRRPKKKSQKTARQQEIAHRHEDRFHDKL